MKRKKLFSLVMVAAMIFNMAMPVTANTTGGMLNQVAATELSGNESPKNGPVVVTEDAIVLDTADGTTYGPVTEKATKLVHVDENGYFYRLVKFSVDKVGMITFSIESMSNFFGSMMF